MQTLEYIIILGPKALDMVKRTRRREIEIADAFLQGVSCLAMSAEGGTASGLEFETSYALLFPRDLDKGEGRMRLPLAEKGGGIKMSSFVALGFHCEISFRVKNGRLCEVGVET